MYAAKEYRLARQPEISGTDGDPVDALKNANGADSVRVMAS